MLRLKNVKKCGNNITVDCYPEDDLVVPHVSLLVMSSRLFRGSSIDIKANTADIFLALDRLKQIWQMVNKEKRMHCAVVLVEKKNMWSIYLIS